MYLHRSVRLSARPPVSIMYKCTCNCDNLFTVTFNPHKPASSLRFYAPKMHKPKNLLYNACLDKTFPSSRNASPILIKSSLFYSPLNSRSDDSYHRSLQGKSPSSAGFKSFIFISLLCFHYTLSKSDHNLVVVPPTNICLLPSCFSRDSASDGVFLLRNK